MKGKTILMYLADGEPTGLLVAEIRNWTGKVLVALRSQLDQLGTREEVRRSGGNLLVGPDPDDPFVWSAPLPAWSWGSGRTRTTIVIESKFRRSPEGRIEGAGLVILPKDRGRGPLRSSQPRT